MGSTVVQHLTLQLHIQSRQVTVSVKLAQSPPGIPVNIMVPSHEPIYSNKYFEGVNQCKSIAKS